jgi:superfamily I DNA/RNA helicase
MEEKLEYTRILRALMELPFQVGRNLLVDFLLGDYKNKSISKSRLDELDNFGSLNWDRSRLFGEIDRLISNGMIEMVQSDYNRFVKVLSLTIRGRNEITRPTMEAKKLGNRVDFGETKIEEGDREAFEKYADFLEMFNEEQKKAIVSGAKNLLCVAGAGSGKTTVLTKRIDFLVKHKGVEPSKILAVTFTRKARREMERRLNELGVSGVKVHTFNSFCERVLQRHGIQIYGRQVRVQSYGDKILAMNMALATMGLEMGQVVDEYFNVGQKKFRTASQLANAFMNDCFAVMDYFKVSGKRDYDFSKDVEGKDKVNAERVYRITQYLREHMETQGLRDYSDQIIDAVDFFKKQPASVPNFEHVLVDEYQDVNALQIELLGLLKSENLFVVGDPRQSIFGWRGSDVNYILNFEKDFGDAEVVHLKRNYRSREGVIEFMNHVIRDMGLPDLEGHLEGEARIRVLDFESEDAERNFVLREIEDEGVPLGDIFVLARTNRMLMELSKVMKERGIVHFVREDDSAKLGAVSKGREGVTLATVHAIKGLEAKKVFVIGANEQNFPCKTSDHPAVEMVKNDDYDREEEERRLFYVAVSRAKEELVVSYSGKRGSYYITSEMREMVGRKLPVVEDKSDVDEGLVGELKSWRSIVGEERGVPVYAVLTNATIDEIAEKKPESAEELMKISGIGPEKLMKYGGKILGIVGDFGN